MRTLQGKLRPGIVVKIGRLPAILVVATGALRRVFAAGKLTRVRIAVATGALHRCRSIVDVL